jgi:hypothetical protein
MNLLTLAIFCGGLEYMAGASFVLYCYFVPAFFANPFTAAIFYFPLRALHPQWWESFRQIEDVGASLGIFGCAGALSCFFRRAPLLLAGMASGTFAYSVLSGDALSLNHVVAAIMGLGLAAWRLESPRVL